MTKLCDGSNENIIKVIQTGNFEDLSFAYIDMELCDMDLDEYIKMKWSLYPIDGIPDECRIWDIMTQIAGGLTFVHSKKEIHRDLKPSNGMDLHAFKLIGQYYSLVEIKRGN
jgi:serine/threonine protein kinase